MKFTNEEICEILKGPLLVLTIIFGASVIGLILALAKGVLQLCGLPTFGL
jgi:hypothetical protein